MKSLIYLCFQNRSSSSTTTRRSTKASCPQCHWFRSWKAQACQTGNSLFERHNHVSQEAWIFFQWWCLNLQLNTNGPQQTKQYLINICNITKLNFNKVNWRIPITCSFVYFSVKHFSFNFVRFNCAASSEINWRDWRANKINVFMFQWITSRFNINFICFWWSSEPSFVMNQSFLHVAHNRRQNNEA